MMSPDARAGACGFTLIEALVALALLAAGLAAIGRLGYGALAAARRAEDRLELTFATRAALTALPDRRAARDGTTSGQILADRWRLTAATFRDLPAGGPVDSGWIAQALELSVSDAKGGSVAVQTVRLRRP